MKIKAWRIVKEKYAKEAFSGEGARIFGGRWNTVGTSIVYVSESLSLAALEILVGGITPSLLGRYSRISVEFDDTLVASISMSNLPRGWEKYPPGIKTQKIGDLWFKKASSAVLKVPSAVIQNEFNYLINPVHPDIKKIIIGKTERFSFDKRLIV